MAQDERYNGWTNYETWCVALWINNDQGWQESVHEDVRAFLASKDQSVTSPVPAYLASATYRARRAGEIVRENVERAVCWDFGRDDDTLPANLSSDLVGRALERVSWDELGATFLTDLAEIDSYDAEQED